MLCITLCYLLPCLTRDREPCLSGYGALACRISRRFVGTAAAPFLPRSLYEQVANRATQNHPEVHQKALAAQVSASVIFSVVLPGISHCSMKSCPWQEQGETDTAGCTYQNSQDTDMLLSPLALRGKKTVSSFGGYYSWLLPRMGLEHAEKPDSVFATWAGKLGWGLQAMLKKLCLLRTVVCFLNSERAKGRNIML